MKTITAEEFHKKSIKNPPIAIDVRERWEYLEYSIGNLNIPLYSLPERIRDLYPYKNQEIVLYCKSGNRSKLAMKYLEENGFTNVSDIEGGIIAITQFANSRGKKES